MDGETAAFAARMRHVSPTGSGLSQTSLHFPYWFPPLPPSHAAACRESTTLSAGLERPTLLRADAVVCR